MILYDMEGKMAQVHEPRVVLALFTALYIFIRHLEI